ncbi:unnamed protein product [Prunus armeniaca]|uniref:Retrotransposon Copia-like N-terminal domain-containing protein n=1 Tax=Prunus armeniaca TaxID=36596 RepID=A0A6J5Y1E6_PRUAR|nr:unnamed protein product [Prunus armeniaca]
MGKNSVTPLVHRLSGFLDGVVVAPTDSDNGDSKEWEAIDTTILNLIAASLSDDAFSEMINCKSATEAWTTLTDRYTSISERGRERIRVRTTVVSQIGVFNYECLCKSCPKTPNTAGFAFNNRISN